MENQKHILEERTVLEIQDIMSILPHRYPFLLIDRLMEFERKKRIVAIKNVTINEPFFAGHFPNDPIMPGVLIVESIAQAGGALLLTEIPDRDSKLMVFTGIERAKFRKMVVPGDQLRIEIDVLNWKPRAVRMQGRCTVDGKLACEAIVMCQLVPRQKDGAGETSAAAGSSEGGSVEKGSSAGASPATGEEVLEAVSQE
jgi:3-hydroxyacyl-[acyl-carrier-protein] dehydratase